MLPACASWKVWTGEEIEGTTSIGKKTLFIRDLPFRGQPEDFDVSVINRKGKIKRVWFTKEFTNWALLRKIVTGFEEACLETEMKIIENVPKDVLKLVTIYLKVPCKYLKPGDFVCVGPAFSDEAFKIGTGAKVSPEDYGKDVRIL